MPRRSSSSATARVVVSSEIDELMPRGRFGNGDQAAKAGAVVRKKFGTNWLYARDMETLERSIDALGEEAQRVCRRWLLHRLPVVAAKSAKDLRTPQLSKSAAEVLMREIVRRGSLCGIPLLTARYQPYLALHRDEDSDAIQELISWMCARLISHGEVNSSDLPDPGDRVLEEWRRLILGHGEYKQCGWLDGPDRLVAWQ